MSDDLPLPDVSNHVGDASGQVVQIGVVHGDVNLGVVAAPAALPQRLGLVPPRAGSFQERDVPMSARVTVLSGLGGVGKTQLAADHAERRWAAGEIRLLLWVSATSRDAIVTSYADAAAKLTGRPDADPERGARSLLELLATTSEPWLVVLDDLRSPTDLNGWWPPASGQVVVTTRRRDASLRGDQRELVDVGVFSEDQALACLRSSLDRPGLLDGAAELAEDLGRLPLALAQAAAYMLDRQLSCAQYRTRLKERRLAAVAPDELPAEHRATVAATWSLSVEQADALTPRGLARPLLDIASALDANGIPLGLFTTPAVLMFLSARTGHEVDESDARDGLGCLRRLNPISFDTGSAFREVRVHALLQRATRDTWPDEHRELVAETAADALNQVVRTHGWTPDPIFLTNGFALHLNFDVPMMIWDRREL